MNDNMTNCKICGEPIAKNAKVCPKCGASNKKFSQKFIWIAMILIAIIVAVVGFKNYKDTAPSSGGEMHTVQNPTISKSKILDTYKEIAENATNPFVINDKASAFIKDHLNFFPGNESIQGAISDFCDHEITYGHLTKNISKYGDKLIYVYGNVVDIEENEDSTMTCLHIMDYDENSYVLYYLGTLEDIFEGNDVAAYALPFDIISFENLGGGYTEAVVGAACYTYLPY